MNLHDLQFSMLMHLYRYVMPFVVVECTFYTVYLSIHHTALTSSTIDLISLPSQGHVGVLAHSKHKLWESSSQEKVLSVVSVSLSHFSHFSH